MDDPGTVRFGERIRHLPRVLERNVERQGAGSQALLSVSPSSTA